MIKKRFQQHIILLVSEADTVAATAERADATKSAAPVPLVSAKSSVAHAHHKKRRHHKRHHKHHHGHHGNMYPLKDHVQTFVGREKSNLLSGVKTPHQDFEMTNGEVFEHGGVPDLSKYSSSYSL